MNADVRRQNRDGILTTKEPGHKGESKPQMDSDGDTNQIFRIQVPPLYDPRKSRPSDGFPIFNFITF